MTLRELVVCVCLNGLSGLNTAAHRALLGGHPRNQINPIIAPVSPCVAPILIMGESAREREEVCETLDDETGLMDTHSDTISFVTTSL